MPAEPFYQGLDHHKPWTVDRFRESPEGGRIEVFHHSMQFQEEPSSRASTSILLVNPPLAKCCEPPAGIARLCGFLETAGVRTFVLDENVEGSLDLMRSVTAERHTDTWSLRAVRNREDNLTRLRDPRTYGNIDRYSRAVADLNHLMTLAGKPHGVRLSLSDFQSPEISPVRSEDLVRAFESPDSNPFYSHFSRRLPEALAESKAATVGFSLNFLSQAICTFAMAGFLKKRFPGVRIILGGGLVTSWMRRPGWRNPFTGLVDALIDGPGEMPLLAALGGGTTLPRQALPDYSGFPLDLYLSPGRVLPYSASSGCYWQKCAFCPERAEGNAYRPIPVPRAMDEISSLIGTTRPSLLHLLDNALSPRLLRSMAEGDRMPPWYGFTRITRHLADIDFCRALRRNGCVMLKLGVESGDQNVLDRENKGGDVELSSKALTALHGAGISTYVYLLFGTPAESEEAARKTLRFAVDHSDRISFLNLAIFNLPLNGPEASMLDTRLHSEGDLSLYTDFLHPMGWDRARVRRFLDREFRRHPALMPVLRRDPPCFTSNHAAFFHT